MTYAILARDRMTGTIGGAVQSHFFNVGPVVLWPKPGIGIVATMAMAEPAYGQFGLEMLQAGASPRSVLDDLLARDPASPVRQVAVMGVDDAPVAFTGSACVPAAGHCVQADVVALGNLLANDGTWDRMMEAFNATMGSLALRLLAALDAAEAAGGDIRGKQSAALTIVDATSLSRDAERVFSVAPRIDVRVDDSSDPLPELRRLVALDAFYKKLLGLLQVPGLLAGDASIDSAVQATAFATLYEGERLLQNNHEATFWLAVLLVRSGRLDEARQRFAAALTSHPPLAVLVQRLTALGMLSSSQFNVLMGR